MQPFVRSPFHMSNWEIVTNSGNDDALLSLRWLRWGINASTQAFLSPSWIVGAYDTYGIVNMKRQIWHMYADSEYPKCLDSPWALILYERCEMMRNVSTMRYDQDV